VPIRELKADCEMVYPMRRFFRVKIWLTEASSDDDDNEEQHFVCRTPATSPENSPELFITRKSFGGRIESTSINSSLLKPVRDGKYLEAKCSPSYEYDGDSSEGYVTLDEISCLGYVSHTHIRNVFCFFFSLLYV